MRLMEQLAAAVRAPSSRTHLGDRVRQLRIAKGLTQTDLAGDRFSKEYVSQIERGKTRPTAETIAWLGEKLGVDSTFIEIGVSTDERNRVEGILVRAEASLEKNAFDEAVQALVDVAPALAAVAAPELELRALCAEAWGRMYQGDVRKAIAFLEQAREIAETPQFSDVERADILFRLGCCRFKLSSISTAVSLLSEAYDLATRSELPADRLRAHILEWRSRCYQRQRDFEAAREDVERALELAEGLDDTQTQAHVYFQASLVAERTGHWVLARTYAERAKERYQEVADDVNVGKLLNNLGGLNFLLGRPERAIEYLKDAFRVALDVDNQIDAAYAISSLAQVHQRIGENALAEEQARQALELLAGRDDQLQEIGNAQLVLGRALLDQGRIDDAGDTFELAAASFSQISSASHKAAAWVAQGDVAAARGNDRNAAELYRRAAETLQDFRF
jgi:tetratricopeptide (TPR) repeat protein